MIENQTGEINLKIENEVSKRIDSLFDGHTLTHEKQWELEKRVAHIEREVEDIKGKIA